MCELLRTNERQVQRRIKVHEILELKFQNLSTQWHVFVLAVMLICKVELDLIVLVSHGHIGIDNVPSLCSLGHFEMSLQRSRVHCVGNQVSLLDISSLA